MGAFVGDQVTPEDDLLAKYSQLSINKKEHRFIRVSLLVTLQKRQL